jgi:hypothetical protein
MKQKAPTSVEALTGATIRTTEAAQTLQSDYLAFWRCDQGRSSDLPFLPYRM